MYESALQFTKLCVSKKGLDCCCLDGKGLLQACECLLTLEISRLRKIQSCISSEHILF